MALEGEALAAWLRSRAGKLTASRMNDALALKRDGTPTEARSKLLRELLAERLTGESVRHFVTDAMAWGLEREAEAKAAYEAETGIIIAEAGFFDHPEIDGLGATPDGLIERDGLIETKCPQTSTMVEWVMAGVVPEQHKSQMIVQLACTGRAWCEFVAFDPRIRDARRRLFVRRYTPTAEETEKTLDGARRFLADLDAMWEAFTGAPA